MKVSLREAIEGLPYKIVPCRGDPVWSPIPTSPLHLMERGLRGEVLFLGQHGSQRDARRAATAGPYHGVASLWVRRELRGVNVKDDHQARASAGGQNLCGLREPQRLLSHSRVGSPGEGCGQRAVTFRREIAEFSKAGHLAWEVDHRAAELRLEVASRVVVARVTAGLQRADDAFVVMHADAVGHAGRSCSSHALVIHIVVPAVGARAAEESGGGQRTADD